jgi:hypothetical protein
MLRWMTPFLAAMFAVGTAAAQDSGAAKPADAPAVATPADSPAAAKPAEPPATAKTEAPPAATKPAAKPAAAKRVEKQATARRAAVRAASQLPPGLPRAHYNYRTTVAPGAAPLYARRGRTVVVEEESLDLPLISGGVEAYAPRIFGAPLLPGSSTLPGYYGTNHSYSYDGAYYGGPSYGPYWNRLPYACGVYGYC